MKAVYCTVCGDLYTPRMGETKSCHCGKTWASVRQHTDISRCAVMEVSGPGLPIALCTNHLRWAQQRFALDKRTSFVQCWTIDPTQDVNDVVLIQQEEA